jgi:hypothetical protein
MRIGAKSNQSGFIPTPAFHSASHYALRIAQTLSIPELGTTPLPKKGVPSTQKAVPSCYPDGPPSFVLPFRDGGIRNVGMKRLTAAALFFLAACSQQSPQDELAKAPQDNAPDAVAPPQPPLNPPAPGEPGGLPDDRTPLAEGPIDPRSAQGAAQVLQHYFALAEQGKVTDKNELWSKGAEKLDLSKYSEVHANIGAPGDSEGAAGSIYVDVPVQLYGRTKDGKEFNSLGTMTLRRVNDVPGSTAEEREWHIYKAVFPAS